MSYTNTTQVLQQLGSSVVNGGRRILRNFKPYPATTSRNTLFKSMDYLVTTSDSGVSIEFVFGSADDYWQFVDKGVRGAKPSKHKGRPRAQVSPFKFSTKMPPRKAIDRWVVRKPLKAARGEDGKFIARKSLVFAIQKTIFEKGIHRTQFFTRPYETALSVYEDRILEALALDLEGQIETIIDEI